MLRVEDSSQHDKDLCQVSIDDEMTIYTIAGLKQDFTELLDCYQKFELNLENIEEFDSAGVQLLLALKKELNRREKIFEIVAMSEAVTRLFKRYSLEISFVPGDEK